MAGGQTPKKHQSYSRTHKRRAQHKITPPAANLCPNCHEPKLPHRVCGNCGWYRRRQVFEPQGSTGIYESES